jgi:molybdopterin converting factor small subunit
VNIEIRLFASLRRYLPSSASKSSATLDVPAGATITTVLEKLGIPAGAAHLTLVDGTQETNMDRKLEEGCTLSVFPPVAGG